MSELSETMGLRYTRKAARLSKDMLPKTPESEIKTSKLEVFGISEKESFYAQKISSIPEERLNEILDEGVRITKEALLREARANQPIENKPLGPLPPNKYRAVVIDPPWPMA